jgi:hypothetical protein
VPAVCLQVWGVYAGDCQRYLGTRNRPREKDLRFARAYVKDILDRIIRALASSAQVEQNGTDRRVHRDTSGVSVLAPGDGYEASEEVDVSPP